MRALINLSISAARAPHHARTRLIDFEVDELHIQQAQRGRDSRVLSPHTRAVVNRACKEKLDEVTSSPPEDEVDAHNRPHLVALIESVAVLLDAPDEKLYTLARTRLEAEGHPDEEIKRGLAAALRSPKFQQLQAQIQRGMSWH
jgi:hypothetical protein